MSLLIVNPHSDFRCSRVPLDRLTRKIISSANDVSFTTVDITSKIYKVMKGLLLSLFLSFIHSRIGYATIKSRICFHLHLPYTQNKIKVL